MAGIYELSAMDISMSNMTSLSQRQHRSNLTRTSNWDTQVPTCLTVLVMATILTVVSLDLRRYGTIACQLQERLIWPHGVCSMNSLSCLARSLSRSLGSQDLRKEENEDTNDTTKDQRSTPPVLNFKQAVPDKPEAISSLTSEEEPNLAQILRNKGSTPSLRTHRCTRCSKLHLVLVVLLMTEANNALSTAPHLPTFDDAANPGAPKPLSTSLTRIRSS
jgi:hypothetical protein